MADDKKWRAEGDPSTVNPKRQPTYAGTGFEASGETAWIEIPEAATAAAAACEAPESWEDLSASEGVPPEAHEAPAAHAEAAEDALLRIVVQHLERRLLVKQLGWQEEELCVAEAYDVEEVVNSELARKLEKKKYGLKNLAGLKDEGVERKLQRAMGWIEEKLFNKYSKEKKDRVAKASAEVERLRAAILGAPEPQELGQDALAVIAEYDSLVDETLTVPAAASARAESTEKTGIHGLLPNEAAHVAEATVDSPVRAMARRAAEIIARNHSNERLFAESRHWHSGKPLGIYTAPTVTQARDSQDLRKFLMFYAASIESGSTRSPGATSQALFIDVRIARNEGNVGALWRMLSDAWKSLLKCSSDDDLEIYRCVRDLIANFEDLLGEERTGQLRGVLDARGFDGAPALHLLHDSLIAATTARLDTAGLGPLPKALFRPVADGMLHRRYLARFELANAEKVPLLLDVRPTNFRKESFRPDKWQAELLNVIDNDESVVVTAPTSSGKSFASYYVISKIADEGKGCVVFVSPTRALMNQMAASIKYRYKDHENVRVGLMSANYRLDEERSNVLVCTDGCFEILLSTPSSHRRLTELGVRYVVFDEVHSCGEGRELGGSYTRSIEMCPWSFIAMSATLSNAESFVNWLRRVHGHPVRQIPAQGDRILRWSQLAMNTLGTDGTVRRLHPFATLPRANSVHAPTSGAMFELSGPEVLALHDAIREVAPEALKGIDIDARFQSLPVTRDALHDASTALSRAFCGLPKPQRDRVCFRLSDIGPGMPLPRDTHPFAVLRERDPGDEWGRQPLSFELSLPEALALFEALTRHSGVPVHPDPAEFFRGNPVNEDALAAYNEELAMAFSRLDKGLRDRISEELPESRLPDISEVPGHCRAHPYSALIGQKESLATTSAVERKLNPIEAVALFEALRNIVPTLPDLLGGASLWEFVRDLPGKVREMRIIFSGLSSTDRNAVLEALRWEPPNPMLGRPHPFSCLVRDTTDCWFRWPLPLDLTENEVNVLAGLIGRVKPGIVAGVRSAAEVTQAFRKLPKLYRDVVCLCLDQLFVSGGAKKPKSSEYVGALVGMLNSKEQIPAIVFCGDETEAKAMFTDIADRVAPSMITEIKRVGDSGKEKGSKIKQQKEKEGDVDFEEKQRAAVEQDANDALEVIVRTATSRCSTELADWISGAEGRYWFKRLIRREGWKFSDLRFRALLAGIAMYTDSAEYSYLLLVEVMFQRGLIRMVLSTSVLAVGVNLPVRSVVLMPSMKDQLDPTKLRHMGGRAGRRGYDHNGHVIFAGFTPAEIGSLAFTGPSPLRLQQTLDPSVVLHAHVMHRDEGISGNVSALLKMHMRLLSPAIMSDDLGLAERRQHLQWRLLQELLLSCRLLDSHGRPVGFAGLVSHTPENQPGSLALAYALGRTASQASFFGLCNGYRKKKAAERAAVRRRLLALLAMFIHTKPPRGGQSLVAALGGDATTLQEASAAIQEYNELVANVAQSLGDLVGHQELLVELANEHTVEHIDPQQNSDYAVMFLDSGHLCGITAAQNCSDNQAWRMVSTFCSTLRKIKTASCTAPSDFTEALKDLSAEFFCKYEALGN